MSTPITLEICVETISSARAAERGGASRIELCSDLIEGGVTPSAGLIAAVRSAVSLDLHVLIRPRPWDFYYSPEEIEIMRRDIELAKDLGANGVVFGLLDLAGNVDVDTTRALIQLARPMSVTFHRAFDMTADLLRALEDVCATGADRILTSGGEQTCMQGLDTVAALVAHAKDRLQIMAGGGIRQHNAAEIIRRTGLREIHAALGSPLESPMLHRNPGLSMGKRSGTEYQGVQVLEEDVRALRQAISGPTRPPSK